MHLHSAQEAAGPAGEGIGVLSRMDRRAYLVENGTQVGDGGDPEVQQRYHKNVRGLEVKQKWLKAEKGADEDLGERKE